MSATAIGPRRVLVPVEACDGCPALQLDPSPSGRTAAACRAKTGYGGEPETITPYWRRGRPAPSWCPALP